MLRVLNTSDFVRKFQENHDGSQRLELKTWFLAFFEKIIRVLPLVLSKNLIILSLSCKNPKKYTFSDPVWVNLGSMRIHSLYLSTFLQYSKKLHLFQKYTIRSRKKRCIFFSRFPKKLHLFKIWLHKKHLDF